MPEPERPREPVKPRMVPSRIQPVSFKPIAIPAPSEVGVVVPVVIPSPDEIGINPK